MAGMPRSILKIRKLTKLYGNFTAVNGITFGVHEGEIVGLLIRFGPSVEVLAWSVPFLFLPFSVVYYPVDVLPPVVKGSRSSRRRCISSRACERSSKRVRFPGGISSGGPPSTALRSASG